MTIKTISSEKLQEKLTNKEDILLLDVRTEEKYNQYHIEDSRIETLNIEKNNIFNFGESKNKSLSSLPKDKEIIVTCTTGNSATKCAALLSERDYNVVVLEGGVTAWKNFVENKAE